MGFFFLCLLAIIGLVVVPFFSIIDYLAELDNRFVGYRDWVRVVKHAFDMPSANVSSEGLSFWCFIFSIFFIWLHFEDWNYYVIYTLGFFNLFPFVGLAAFFRAEQIRKERLRSARNHKVPQWPVAQAFRFGFPIFITAAWAITVQPWSGGGVSPIRVAVCSAFAALISLITMKVIEFDRAHTGRRKIDFALTKELVQFLSVIAFVSFFVVVLNIYLDKIAEENSQYVTVRAVLTLQHRIELLAEYLKKIPLWVSVVTVLLGIVFLHFGRPYDLELTIKGSKAATRGLGIAGQIALAIGSFSLSGSMVAGSALSHTFALKAGVVSSIQALSKEVEHSIVVASAETALDTSPCGGSKKNPDQCPTTSLQLLFHELDSNQKSPDKFAVSWLNTNKSEALKIYDVQSNSVLSRLDANNLLALEAIQDASLGAMVAADTELTRAEKEPDSTSERSRREIAEMSVDLLLGLLPIKIDAPFGEDRSALTKAFSDKITDALRDNVTKSTRDILVELIAACSQGAAACKDKAKVFWKTTRENPHVIQIAAGLAFAFRATSEQWKALYEVVKQKNEQERDETRKALEQAARSVPQPHDQFDNRFPRIFEKNDPSQDNSSKREPPVSPPRSPVESHGSLHIR